MLATVHEGRPHVTRSPMPATVTDCSSTARRAPGASDGGRLVRRSVLRACGGRDPVELQRPAPLGQLPLRSRGGCGHQADRDEHWAALDLLVDLLVPGRNSEIVPVTSKDAAKTMTLALPISDGHWLMKARTGDETWLGPTKYRTTFGWAPCR